MLIEQLVDKSTAQYRAMLDHLATITEILKTADPQAITHALEQWNRLQQEARQVDAQIELEHNPVEQKAILPKFDQRTDLMSQVAQQCQQVYSRANTLKALASDELHRLHQGRRALGGYKGPGSSKGSRLTASL